MHQKSNGPRLLAKTAEQEARGGALAGARGRVRAALPSWPVAIAVATAYGAGLLLNVSLDVDLWLCSAILLAALLRNRVATWPALILLTAAVQVAGFWFNSAAGFSSPVFASGAIYVWVIANTVESLVVAAFLKRLSDGTRWYHSIKWMTWFAGLSIASTALSTAMIVVGMSALSRPHNPWFELILTSLLSILLFTPLILHWLDRELRRDLTPGRMTELALLGAIGAALTCVTFLYDLPILFAVFPILAVMTMRGGLAGATIGAAIVTAIGAWYTSRGLGPIATWTHLSPDYRGLVLQLYFLSCILVTLPLAIVLRARQALAEELRRQCRISDAALNNMAQGLCMFDASDRLVTCNRRLAELYDLPDHMLLPGTPASALLRPEAGGEPVSEETRDPAAEVGDGDQTPGPRREIELPDGRIIEIQRRPMPDGGWVATHEDVTESRLAAKRIAYLANHDPLTGMPNRACFHEHLQRSVSHAQRGVGFALHCLDLDRFKAVNDTLGHAAGDELLKQVAERLRQVVRNGDVVARLGGDEFAIIQFPLTSAEEAAALGGRIVEALGKPFWLAGHEAVIGASIGIVPAPVHGVEPAELLQKGDLALYRAKTDGRNTYRFFEPGMDSALHKRRVLETELRAAIQKGEFELLYQPILSLETGTVTTLEALLRWRHPVRGLVEASEFVGLAEETGLIVPIGEWMLRDACREAASWPGDTRVAVNVSPMQFRMMNFEALVTNALKAARLAPERLELEITEALLLQNPDEVLGTLLRLHQTGIRIAMDDFGSGYCSLSYLRRFPFDKIKIDGSFVRGLTSEEDCIAIVHATAELSTKLGMCTTADGVETEEQIAVLRSQGCTEIQGQYVSKPLVAKDVRRELARRSPADRVGAQARHSKAR